MATVFDKQYALIQKWGKEGKRGLNSKNLGFMRQWIAPTLGDLERQQYRSAPKCYELIIEDEPNLRQLGKLIRFSHYSDQSIGIFEKGKVTQFVSEAEWPSATSDELLATENRFVECPQKGGRKSRRNRSKRKTRRTYSSMSST